MKKVRIIPLGGLGEIGMNMTVIETDTDMIIVDCGIAFPDDFMLGVDLVIPDMNYVYENKTKLRGILITHGHEDHIGAIPYLLEEINVPIFATSFTMGVIKQKLTEKEIKIKIKEQIVSPSDKIILGDFEVEFINVNHSIPGAIAMAIKTPCGTIIHTGDFKIDMTPTYGTPIDLAKFGQYGTEGVRLLLCESTNAEKPDTTKSESEVATSIDDLFLKYRHRRITVATFSSNVFRLQSVVNAAVKYKRKIVFTGRSMLNISDVAIQQDILKIPNESLITIEEVSNYKDEEICLITTGSQGEPMSVLYKLAFGEYKALSLDKNDVVILSSHTISGNEKLVNVILNKLAEKDVTIVNDYNTSNIHASGHACQEELKIIQTLIHPEYFMPIHGEYKHLKANKDIAIKIGINENNIFITKLGQVIEMTNEKITLTDEFVQNGKILIDGNSIGDIGPVVLRERQILSQNGIIFINLVISERNNYLLAEPQITTKGFIYLKESEEIIKVLKDITITEFTNAIEENKNIDITRIQDKIKNKIYRFVKEEMDRTPMIIPMIQTI